MYLSIDLWHSNKMKVILHKFAKHHCFLNSLNTELCWLYSFFLCWFFLVKPNNFKENFILKFPKNMIKPPSLWKRSYEITPVHLSASPCVMHFSQDLLCGFSYFFAWWYFAIYNKKWQIQILENCICCLDKWVNKPNLDQKQKIFILQEF